MGDRSPWKSSQFEKKKGCYLSGGPKSFPIESDEYLLKVNRYVERNALRANLVERAEDWQWSSLWRHQTGNKQRTKLLSDWPITRPGQWLKPVNQALTEGELMRSAVWSTERPLRKR